MNPIADGHIRAAHKTNHMLGLGLTAQEHNDREPESRRKWPGIDSMDQGVSGDDLARLTRGQS